MRCCASCYYTLRCPYECANSAPARSFGGTIFPNAVAVREIQTTCLAASKRGPKVDKKPSKKPKTAPAKACKSQAEEQPEPAAVVLTEAEEPVSDPPAQQPAAAAVMSDRSNHQAASTQEHPEYGMRPHPDAEIKMVGSKAFWEYIDDKGAEVSVVRCPSIMLSRILLCRQHANLLGVFRLQP